ncbi:tRNA uridine-5-carboxymethylaminomethyl(34) synthesis GTPase MnmE [Alterisphingorhabdus coralli]|uniref:tRNA modification GTPase MnmE n=1 Tax=Alterisphingorhabdus coralli TaxID=3071408 RepID=A0AA97F7L0_9SPHN|nr:tRNA uridine-5-carboxymethylaminomethyl(34) synthesis GTPase MnmE [Parasphingorhabdus sp. SCSIO 66989]WOE75448.1 tRNA uridine-5-carboxymethylaminomethyl(34) synthesis GTPase MnmE [Parasphingorhabdus sp. SCSIO 66989]
MSPDTIFAVSSGAPPSAISVIRISGPHSGAALTALAGELPEPRRAVLRSLKHPVDSHILDSALVLWFPGPRTATGEDCAELHCHGGRAVIVAVSAALGAIDGCRPAEAGEFTRRAFANGVMDLAEAEALSDLLAAETERQRKQALDQAGGLLSRQIEDWRQRLLQGSALVESELDFSDEDDVDAASAEKLRRFLSDLASEVETALATPPAERLHDGLRVVIAGPPNAGKSTLLNRLVQREAAIVTDIAGTTRDIIEAPVTLNGIAYIFTDTAGLREDSADAVEAIGINRAQQALVRADIVLWLGAAWDKPDHPALIDIAAKADLGADKAGADCVVSAKTGEGVEALISQLTKLAQTLLPPLDQPAWNARQRGLLRAFAEALGRAQLGEDMLVVGEELRLARLALDQITGRSHVEDMLDTLFGKFCIGK